MSFPHRLRRSAAGFPVFLSFCVLAAWTVLRIALWIRFRPARLSPMETARSFLTGFHLDLVMSVTAVAVLIGLSWGLSALIALPAGLTGMLKRRPYFSAWMRRLFPALMSLFCMGGVFLLISEWYFFSEFESRFNTVAIDYLIYPHEVFTNIRESYPVPAILAACLAGGLALCRLAFRYFPPMPGKRSPGACSAVAGGWVALCVAGAFTVRPSETAFSSERIVNELANNGWASAARAAWTRDLDFTAFYTTLPPLEALSRARRQLAEPGVTFAGPEVTAPPVLTADGGVDPERNDAWFAQVKKSLTRQVAGDPARPRLNVCILLEESLGSEFWGSLGCTSNKGRPRTFTPRMDALAKSDGMLFTHLFADGNRTIRGFEGVFSSIPPLPGDSILARDKTENVETIARVLKRDGYQSLFLYGGRGTFDNIASYTLRNGWDRLIGQDDYVNPVHTTAWGVSDEDLFHRGIEEMRALHRTGRPFLVSFMTVSNHLPFTYPAGRIPEDPKARSRRNAVKYADWALGDFFDRVKKEDYWKDTVFVVIADHGARVYGSETIPMMSYRIPMLVAGPAVVPGPRRVEVTGCQLDVTPTLLGLIGRPYESLFFGHNLLEKDAAARSRCLMHHNRSIAIYRDGRQVVYGLNKVLEFREGDPRTAALTLMAAPDAGALELSRDGAALFQTADLLYDNRLFRLDNTAAAAVP
ncbi:MAG: LTA synthase family protein [Verrucomicrobiota bacterium]